MKRSTTLLVALAATALLVAGAGAWATTTWTRPSPLGQQYEGSLGTSSTPDESAPTAATDGFSVEGNRPYLVTVEARTYYSFWGDDAGIAGYRGDGGCVQDGWDGGCLYPTPGVSNDDPDAAYFGLVEPTTTFKAGLLKAYWWNPASRSWGEYPYGNLVVTPGLTREIFPVILPVSPPVGRIAYVPIGLGVPVRVYVAMQR